VARKTFSWLGAVAIVVAVAALAILPRLPHLGLGGGADDPAGVGDIHLGADRFDPDRPVGGPFTLVDGDGNTVTQDSFPGRYLLVYFGYTYCPDVCPTSLQTMRLALDLLKPDVLARLQPLFISVDPDRDPPRDVQDYASVFHPDLIGLTGTPEQVAAAVDAYQVYVKRVEVPDSVATYLIDHSAITYLMAPDGTLAAWFRHGIAPEAMAEGLRAALTQGTAAPPS